MSLSPESIRALNSIKDQVRSGRKHWDLYRHLYSPFIIYDALRLVLKSAGSGGLDGVRVQDIRGREWKYAEGIVEEIRSGRYQPSAVKRVYIPKADGSQRPLGIPNIIDRVVQRALVLLLEPIYESKFHDFSYGFRPGKKAVDAAAVVAKECYQLRQVMDADIEKFFDNVNHAKLVGMMRAEIVDPRILRLIKQTLKSGFQEPSRPWQATIKGTPQGGPLSPLLANIYLHYALDEKFAAVTAGREDVKLIRYADDFVILCNRPTQRTAIERLVRKWLSAVGLKLKESKTHWVDMSNESRSHGSKFEFLGFKFHLRCYKDNAQRFWIARQPSEKSRRRLRAAARERLHPFLAVSVAANKLRELWSGWSEYFRYSNANRIFYREIRQMKQIFAWYLKRKYRRQRHAVPMGILMDMRRKALKGMRPIGVRPSHLGL